MGDRRWGYIDDKMTKSGRKRQPKQPNYIVHVPLWDYNGPYRPPYIWMAGVSWPRLFFKSSKSLFFLG